MTKAERKRLLAQVSDRISESGLTLYRLAKESGVDHATLHKFMSGERGLSIDALEKLAAVLGLVILVKKAPRKKK